MTDALKAMIAAMCVELKRQEEEDPVFAHHVDVDDPGEAVLDGRFDLEKVARAGLQAIEEPCEALDGIIEPNFIHDMPEETWRKQIAGILA